MDESSRSDTGPGGGASSLDLEALERGAKEWPGIALTLERFGAWRDARPASRASTVIADQVLACACLERDARAIEHLWRHHFARVERYLGPLAEDAALVDEVRQRLAIRLLVGEDARGPRLADYGGAGALEGWLRVCAHRLALEMKRGERRVESIDGVATWLSDGRNPELSVLRSRYRGDLARALVEVVAGLEPAERLVLRLHYVESMTTAALAALLGVSRATAVRRIGQAREALDRGLVRRVARELGLSERDSAELFASMSSQLEVSLARLLGQGRE